jgi:tRNA(Met) C34 N-acetyltransferase TmcA
MKLPPAKKPSKSDLSKSVTRVRAKPLSPAEQQMYERESAAFARLTTEELVKQFRPMTPEQRARWNRAKAGRPRKSTELKAVRVLFTIDPKLLKQADAYAQSHGLTRAQLIATGIRRVMAN